MIFHHMSGGWSLGFVRPPTGKKKRKKKNMDETEEKGMCTEVLALDL
jgi:hypothetical protein